MLIKKPKVTIGLPVYNGEKYLKEALDSILAQTYDDFELVICDNASTDTTSQICLEYAQREPRIRYYRNERNLGAAPNHNRAFQLAKGEYFKWAGYDDRIAPDFLTKCVDVLDHHPDIVMAMPLSALIDEQGRYLGEYHYKADGDIPATHMRFKNFLLKNESGNYIYGLMRSNHIAKTAPHGSYPSSDLVYIAELSLYGRVFIVPEPLYYRRIHKEQSTKGSLQIERNRILWFDTSLSGKVVLPKWQLLFGFIRAVRKAPMQLRHRIYCYLLIVRWAFIFPHFKALSKDLLLAVVRLIKNGMSMRRTRNTLNADS